MTKWSLKGKENTVGFFNCVDIETLRQKIIKDIQSIPNDVMHPSRKLMVGRIVNKRFGVNE